MAHSLGPSKYWSDHKRKLTKEGSGQLSENIGHHHFMHEGNQVWFKDVDPLWNWKQERQAEEFAAWLTVPASEDADLLYMGPSELARRYRITEELARVRLAG